MPTGLAQPLIPEGAHVDLSPYIARGFPGDADRQIAETPVAGIDKQQAQSMVRLCAETAAELYGPSFSPRALAYHVGSRPVLEEVVRALPAEGAEDTVRAALAWVGEHVRHPHLVGHVAPDRAMSEEDLIASGVGWCNEQARVFIALCEVAGIPGRLCFLFHRNQRCGHTAAEVYLAGKWVFADVTFGVIVRLPGGSLASALELQSPHRDLAHAAYEQPFASYLAGIRPEFDSVPGWGVADRPGAGRAGDMLETIGICNYVIDGVSALQ